jgi:hypothetical protein
MIHIVFNEADVKVLQDVQAIDESLAGDIIQIHDDYAVGPINNIYNPEGIAERHQWWTALLAGGAYEGENLKVEKNDLHNVNKLVQHLTENESEKVWIWAAQNKHDVSGYFWLLNHLKPFQGRVEILYLNNLPFINEKGNIFYPTWLFEIPATEFLKAKKLARVITPSEFEVDPDEWIKLSNENKGIRILEGGKKLVQYDYDYFDAALKKFITPSFQKVNKILQQVGTKAKIEVSDVYLIWRLKSMAAMQVIEMQGEGKDLEFKSFN